MIVVKIFVTNMHFNVETLMYFRSQITKNVLKIMDLKKSENACLMSSGNFHHGQPSESDDQL